MTETHVSSERYAQLLAMAERLDTELREAKNHSSNLNSMMQDDLAVLLLVLGMGDHARPQTPREVMQEIINRVETWRDCLESVRYELCYSTLFEDLFQKVDCTLRGSTRTPA
jgi:hypothetical protein